MGTRTPQSSCRRVLIADDHVMFAETLRNFLEKSYSIVGVVDNGRAMVDEAIRLNPDAIVADIAMPLLNGLDAARRIRELAPKIKFVFLTMRSDPNLAAATFEIGCVAFILKQSPGAELLKALDRVLHGERYLTPKLRPMDWVETESRARQFSKELTFRQRDVVQLIAEGRPLKEVAGLLGVSEKTVEFHKHQVMHAFSLKSNADLVLFAVKQGLIFLDA